MAGATASGGPVASADSSLAVRVGSLAAAVGRLDKEVRELRSEIAQLKGEAGKVRELREKWEPAIDKFLNGPGKLFIKI